MKKILTKSVLILITILIFASCGDSSKTKFNAENLNDLKKIAEQVDKDFNNILSLSRVLADYTVTLYSNQKNYNPSNTNIYSVASNGVMFKKQDDGKSAVFVSGYIPINENIKKIVYFTEPLDSIFAEIVKKNSSVVQVYYNDKYSYNRIYPFFDVLKQYEPKMNIPAYNFYFLADAAHNPDKKPVWVNEPYVDPAGRGWMVSAIAPVYYNDLEGVVGLDVTISVITDKYINTTSKEIFLVDSKGIIVAADEYAISLLNLPALKDHKYFETIKMNTYRQEDYNLLSHKDKNFRTAFEKLINGKEQSVEIETHKGIFTLYGLRIKELDWTLLKIVNLE